LDITPGDAASDERPTLVKNQQALSLLSNEKACLTHGSIEQLEDLATSDSPGLGWSTSLADANKGSRRVVVTRVHEKRDAAD